MRFALHEVIGLLMATVLAYLVLTHYTGFSRSVGAIGSSLSGVAKTLQGR